MVYHIWHRKPGTEMWRHRVVRTRSRAWALAVAMARYPGEESSDQEGIGGLMKGDHIVIGLGWLLIIFTALYLLAQIIRVVV